MWKKAVMIVSFLAVAASVTGPYLRADDDDEEEGEHRGRHSRLYATTRLPSPTHAKWKAECSSCHMLYPPGLLPQRSWTKVMAGLDKHFGENASVDTQTQAEITRFLLENAADRSGDKRSWKISRSIGPAEAPIRISQTPYFLRKHDEISASVWKRAKIKSPANCVACHQGAEQGRFSEHEVSIPR